MNDWPAQNNLFKKHCIRKWYIAVKHLDPSFLTTLVKKSTNRYFWGNLPHTNLNIPSNLFWAKILCILLEERSQCPSISFTLPTELKSSSPLQKIIKQTKNHQRQEVRQYERYLFDKKSPVPGSGFSAMARTHTRTTSKHRDLETE